MYFLFRDLYNRKPRLIKYSIYLHNFHSFCPNCLTSAARGKKVLKAYRFILAITINLGFPCLLEDQVDVCLDFLTVFSSHISQYYKSPFQQKMAGESGGFMRVFEKGKE